MVEKYTLVSEMHHIDRFPAIMGECSEFGVVSTMRGTNHRNHTSILHENCHSSPANRIVCLDPNYVALMSMNCMLTEFEYDAEFS